MTPSRFELVTNFRSPTFLALREAARRLGGDVHALPDLPGRETLRQGCFLGALVFMYGDPPLAEAAADLFREAGLPVALWQVDDPGYLHRPELREVTLRLARRCDLYFSHTRELDHEYAALGVKVEYLPTGARRLPGGDRLYAPPPPEDELSLDYVFVATPSAERRGRFHTLRELLPSHLRGGMIGGVEPLEALRLQRFARVSLFLGAHTGADGRPDGWGLSERSWEVPLVGGLLVQEDRKHLREHFLPGVDAVAFQGLAGCAELVARLCARPEERRAIAALAQQRVLREHMLEHRLARIVERLRAVRDGDRGQP